MDVCSTRNVKAVANTKEFVLGDDNNHYVYTELYMSWHKDPKRVLLFICS